MMRSNLDTVLLRQNAERCEDLTDIRALLRQYDGDYLCWQTRVTQLVDESGLSYVRLAERCGISKNTLKKWCEQGGAPRCRSTFLKLGFGFSMNARETDDLLMRYGGYHRLYPRDRFDAVCLFLLKTPGRYCYDDALALSARAASGKTTASKDPLRTEAALHGILSAADEAAFLAFLQEHAADFSASRDRLASFLRDFLKARTLEISLTGESASIHAFFQAEGIPLRFEKLLSELFRHGEIPRREQLVALGLRLEMTPEELDEMLFRAGMEPLCAKNRLECVLIYALRQLCLMHPELPMSNAMQLLSVTRDEALAARCRETVAEYSQNMYRCAPDEAESVADYVRQILFQLDLDEATDLMELL